MNSEKYISILNDNLINVYDQNLIFQDDNDPKHRSKITTQWKAKQNIKSLDWPSCSPDLNPIENIWSILKTKISKIASKTTLEFEKNIKDEWNKISLKVIKSVIKSMPVRIKKVIENKGDVIDY